MNPNIFIKNLFKQKNPDRFHDQDFQKKGGDPISSLDERTAPHR